MNGRIVTQAGYEGLYQDRPGCHKIVVMVWDMSTMPDGTHLAKSMGSGYFISGQCNGADYPSTKSCGQVTRQGAVILNHWTERSACIPDLISNNEAVARTYMAAGENAIYELKNRRGSSAPIEAVYNRDQRVLQLMFHLPGNAVSRYYTLSMTNSSGREVYSQNVQPSGESAQYFVDVQDLPKGQYRLELSTDRKVSAGQDISLD